MKAVQEQRVVADDEVGVKRRLLPNRRDVAEGLTGDGHAVADPAAQDNHVVGATQRHLAANERDHVCPAMGYAKTCAGSSARPIASASGVALTWQTATASASAA